MPSWKIHLIFDLIIVVVLLGTLIVNGLINNVLLAIFLVLFNILATVFPDIDTPKSKIRGYVSVIVALVATGYLVVSSSAGSILYATVGFVFIYLVVKFFPTKHRGVTHKLWFSVVFSLGLTFILWLMFGFSGFEFGVYYLVILWGYLSHLILDRIG